MSVLGTLFMSIKMREPFTIGTIVSWRWGPGRPRGIIEEIYPHPIEKMIKGSAIKRNGTDENPAYYIKAKNGSYVLKTPF